MSVASRGMKAIRAFISPSLPSCLFLMGRRSYGQGGYSAGAWRQDLSLILINSLHVGGKDS